MTKPARNILNNTYTDSNITVEVMAVFPGGFTLKDTYSGKIFSISDNDFHKNYRKVVSYYG